MTEEFERKRNNFTTAWRDTLDIVAEYFNLQTAEGQLELRHQIAALMQYMPLIEIKHLTYNSDIRSPEWRHTRTRTIQDLTQAVIKRATT